MITTRKELAEFRADCDVFQHLSPMFIAWLDLNRDLVPGLYHPEINRFVEAQREYTDPLDIEYVFRAIEEKYDEGEVEIDSSALVSRSEDPGAYVMAWVWIGNPDMDEAPRVLGNCDVCELPVLSGSEHDTDNGCGELVHADECFDAHNQNCSLCPIGG